jgi:1,2-diacylglycerol 3-alpha-glucosyltransferase
MDYVIVPSEFVKGRLEGWGVKTPIRVIPTGIRPSTSGYSSQELKAKYSIPPRHKILLTVGRVVRDKNISALLRTLQLITKVDPNVTLVLVGPGNLEDFRREAESLGVANNVVMTDSVKPAEARHIYTGADLFVFASQTETQGLVFGEAMNAGLAIAALDSPVRAEFYPESVAAVAADERQLARMTIELLSDSNKRQSYVTAARQFFNQKLSLEAMTNGQLALLNELVS